MLDFKDRINRTNKDLLKINKLSTLQVNLGNMCNQSCAHCHVAAGPGGKQMMGIDVMGRIINFLSHHQGLIIDITGGCPELNPDYLYFLEGVRSEVLQMMVRTNLTVFEDPGLEWCSKWYSAHGVTVIGSLPCYTKENVDKQRGEGVFRKSIRGIRLLNELGYGVDDRLQLNLVYNPGEDFLPGPQEQLEADYKRELDSRYGVRFNSLYTITNAPIGRFKKFLESNGKLQEYIQLLSEHFNPDVAEKIMCRNLLSVDYLGRLYNCDFNQALGIGLRNFQGKELTIDDLEQMLDGDIQIATGEHCFCCTAGAGSSCMGTLQNTRT